MLKRILWNFAAANVVSIAGTVGTDTVTIGLTNGTEGQVVRMGSSAPEWYTLGVGATTFLTLTDTPDDYTDDVASVCCQRYPRMR